MTVPVHAHDVSLHDVTAAEARTGTRVRRTPLLPVSDALTLKCKHLQVTGVFKVRGVFNRLLAALQTGEVEPGGSVVVASGGNAGLTNAHAAAQLGCKQRCSCPTLRPR